MSRQIAMLNLQALSQSTCFEDLKSKMKSFSRCRRDGKTPEKDDGQNDTWGKIIATFGQMRFSFQHIVVIE